MLTEDNDSRLATPKEVSEMVSSAVDQAKDLLSDQAHCVELVQVASASLDELDLSEVHSIGYTFKCLGAGLSTLRDGVDRGFETAVVELVMQGGDADTNAAVGGALLGCHLGFNALPTEWISAMPYAMWLEAWVQKLLFMMRLPHVRTAPSLHTG